MRIYPVYFRVEHIISSNGGYEIDETEHYDNLDEATARAKGLLTDSIRNDGAEEFDGVEVTNEEGEKLRMFRAEEDEDGNLIVVGY